MCFSSHQDFAWKFKFCGLVTFLLPNFTFVGDRTKFRTVSTTPLRDIGLCCQISSILLPEWPTNHKKNSKRYVSALHAVTIISKRKRQQVTRSKRKQMIFQLMLTSDHLRKQLVAYCWLVQIPQWYIFVTCLAIPLLAYSCVLYYTLSCFYCSDQCKCYLHSLVTLVYLCVPCVALFS